VDLGSGLANVIIQACSLPGVKGVGIENLDNLYYSQLWLVHEIFVYVPTLNPNLFLAHGDFTELSSLEGVTHLFMFLKSILPSTIRAMAPVANACSTLRYVASHHRLTEFGWTNLSWEVSRSCSMKGSGAGAVMHIYQRSHSDHVHAITEKVPPIKEFEFLNSSFAMHKVSRLLMDIQDNGKVMGVLHVCTVCLFFFLCVCVCVSLQ
jgi:hypothetical protein